jgi:hypothetical protein
MKASRGSRSTDPLILYPRHQMAVNSPIHASPALRPGKGKLQWNMRLVGSRVGVEVEVKRKIPCPCQDSNPGPLTRSLVAMLIYVQQLLSSQSSVNEDLSLLACYTESDVIQLLNLQWWPVAQQYFVMMCPVRSSKCDPPVG